MATAKLTKRLVDSVSASETGDRWVWDTDLRGLGLKVTPTGRKAFFLKYRAPGQRATQKLSLGAFGPVTVEQARESAQVALGSLARGEDPGRTRSEARTAPRMDETLRDYLRDHGARWKPRTSLEYTRQVSDHLVPHFGATRVRDVTRTEVATFIRNYRDRPVLANRLLALLSAFFTSAIRSGLRADGVNPCRHYPRHKERNRTRFLSRDELARLGRALDAAQAGTWLDVSGQPLPPAAWQSVAAIRLLALTGCRRSEILDLRWDEVDLEHRGLLLRDTKAGESVRPLSESACAILAELPAGEPSDRVLAGTKGRRHEIKSAWNAIRRLAGLEGVRLHDLRHTVASLSQHSGDSLLVTGSLLGHRNLATTQKYAHLISGPVQEAANRVGGEIDALLSGRETPVTPLLRRA